MQTLRNFTYITILILFQCTDIFAESEFENDLSTMIHISNYILAGKEASECLGYLKNLKAQGMTNKDVLRRFKESPAKLKEIKNPSPSEEHDLFVKEIEKLDHERNRALNSEQNLYKEKREKEEGKFFQSQKTLATIDDEHKKTIDRINREYNSAMEDLRRRSDENNQVKQKALQKQDEETSCAWYAENYNNGNITRIVREYSAIPEYIKRDIINDSMEAQMALMMFEPRKTIQTLNAYIKSLQGSKITTK